MDWLLDLQAHSHGPSPSSSPPNITAILSPSRDLATGHSSRCHCYPLPKIPPSTLLLYPLESPLIAAVFLVTLPLSHYCYHTYHYLITHRNLVTHCLLYQTSTMSLHYCCPFSITILRCLPAILLVYHHLRHPFH